MRRHADTPSLLNCTEISQHLQHGTLLVSGTYDLGNLKASSYDLRMADEAIAIPDYVGRPATRGYIKYKTGEKRTGQVKLMPGEVAFLSTFERIRMPWDVTGNIGVKFALASQSVLILTGLVVDPGYGIDSVQGERLHFLLANLGTEQVVLEPGKTKLASIVFIRCKEPTEMDKKRWPPIRGEDLEQRFLDEKASSLVGLGFFQQIGTIQQNIVGVQQEVEDLRKQLARVESGSLQIVMFGVFLVCATLLGISLSVIVSMAANLKVDNLPEALIVAAGIGGIALILRHVLQIFQRTGIGFIPHEDAHKTRTNNRG